jgi:type IV pilus assembly protein PilX
MGRLSSTLNNEQGAVLVITMLIMVLCTLVGIAAVTTSTIEQQIAGNDRLQKLAFYNCDGGTELARELLEQNLEDPGGFTPTEADGGAIINNEVFIEPGSLTFWNNKSDAVTEPSDTNRDFCMPPPANIAAGAPHTNVNVETIDIVPVKGAAQQLTSEYEGKGHGQAASGTMRIYDIFSQREGMNNSTARVRLQWRHVIDG